MTSGLQEFVVFLIFVTFMLTLFGPSFINKLAVGISKQFRCTAGRDNLSGKMFTFPQQTNTAHVRLTTSTHVLKAVTVCLRSFTDLRRAHPLFSMATPSVSNEVLILKDAANDEFQLHIRNKYVDIRGQDYKLNTWHSICTTWDSASGLVQLWLDGKPSSRKFISSGSSISGPIIIVLGQEQDSHGGGFDSSQSFVGMMSDVHMWDYTISHCEIQKYMDGTTFTSGNVLNWNALEFHITDRVLIEDKQPICDSTVRTFGGETYWSL